MRAAIFIDGGYLVNQMQDVKASPDYARLADYLLAPLRRAGPLDLMRCYYYYCAPWVSEKPTDSELRRLQAHERFVAELHALDRWQVRLGKLERRREEGRETYTQKRVDVQLSVDLVHHTVGGHVQHVVIVAGDSDFIPALELAKLSGATITLWCDKDKSVHKDLLVHADEVHYIDWRTFPTRQAAAPAAEPKRRRRGKAASAAAAPPPVAEPAPALEPATEPAPARARAPERSSAAEAPRKKEPAPPAAAPAPAADASASEAGAAPKKKRRRGRRGGRGRRRGNGGDGSSPPPTEA